MLPSEQPERKAGGDKEAQTSYLWEEYEVTPGHAREFQMEEIPERSELKRRVLEVKMRSGNLALSM